MNIPKKIKIGGLKYKVSIHDKWNQEDAVAFIDCQKREIKLEKADQQAMECSFIHEILHGINIALKEEQIEFLAMALYQVIVDNPSIFTNGGEQKK